MTPFQLHPRPLLFYQVARCELLPFAQSTGHLTPAQAAAEAACCAMLTSLLAQRSFYYSYTYDVTCTAQQQAMMVRIAHTNAQMRMHSASPDFLFLCATRLLLRRLLRQRPAFNPQADSSKAASLGLIDAADSRFYWNQFLHRELLGVPEV